jgi:hypothetical protein
MIEAPLPENEAQRLASLQSLYILDTPSEERFERITRVVQRLFDIPIASITLVDVNRQWWGCKEISRRCLAIPRSSRFLVSFCNTASTLAV